MREGAISFIEVRGGRIHYRFDGVASAPVLVLSHSLGTDLDMWEPQIAVLARRFRVLRYDTRGHGASFVAPGPYGIDGLARDALDLLDALEIARAHFCGLSMGGMIGIWLGVNASERVARLVLCNTAARIGSPEIWNARIDTVRKRGMEGIADAVLGRWFTPSFLQAGAAGIDRVRRMLLATPAEGYIACCEAIRDTDLRDAVSRVRSPTLVIAGAADASTPPTEGRFLAERIPGARYVELNAAHLSNLEAAEQFTQAVSTFVSG
jgi:3-oxoadipate enol-lactonase